MWSKEKLPEEFHFQRGHCYFFNASEFRRRLLDGFPHENLDHFGSMTIILCCQKSGQVTSERLHNAQKHISSKTHNRLTGHVNQELGEVKMSMIRQRSQDHNHKKMYQRKDSVPVLCMVCEKLAERVEVDR